jgi:hypothetical protein
MNVKGQEGEGEKATYLEEECTSEACPDEEKVWRVWYVARRVHIIQPQIKQGKRGFQALCTDNQNWDEMLTRQEWQHALWRHKS